MRDDVGGVAIRANLERVLALELQQVGDLEKRARDRFVVERCGQRRRHSRVTCSPVVSILKSRMRAPPSASVSLTAGTSSGAARQKRHPPPPAPHTLAALAPAAMARAISVSMAAVVTPGARRLRFSHSVARQAATASQSP